MRARLAALAVGALAAHGALAAPRTHGLSAFGDLKYPADFTHFAYVNPDAPKGGRLATVGTSAVTTFNSLNAYILKGDAAFGPLGQSGMEGVFDTLMTRAADEPDAVYGLVAHAAEVADDKRSVTFFLRPEARFADGSGLTAEDVATSFRLLKEKGHPRITSAVQDVVGATAVDPLTVRYDFKGDNLRDLPLIVATLPIFAKAFYERVPFESDSLEKPLGSGPYEVAEVRQGTTISYRRRPDYWGWGLPVNRGRWNFDTIRIEYFKDRAVSFQAFKAGQYDLREEFTSKTWATEYDIPSVAAGRVKLMTLPDENLSGAQGFFINTRRPQFADVRVRQALDLAFDFEWMNRTLFYGVYRRTHSYFENSAMKATGLPGAEEMALLEPFRAQLPAAVFAEPYAPPVSDGSGRDRRLLRQATKLLDDAGWRIGGGGLRQKDGATLKAEFLLDDPVSIRLTQPYVEVLRGVLGIDASLRMVDAAQYQERLKNFDFDLDMTRYSLRSTPGPELRTFWSSAAAATPGSFNLAGIADPVIDGLIDRILAARDRPALDIACRATDRVLRAGHYWVPNWFKATHHIATWDRFSWPATKPKYDRGINDTWWFDAAKSAATGELR